MHNHNKRGQGETSTALLITTTQLPWQHLQEHTSMRARAWADLKGFAFLGTVARRGTRWAVIRQGTSISRVTNRD
ncbi:hypothetical protein E2C01_082410 [Portunus trituberculatus]|uniref:Uncharacterized protein n=1 Tax=Portunus trituberculatus TaxID=210409 RepID=A0A5B7IYE7_PORTR|nr:hypothetical protein [Portunus trituberculatus]